MADRVEFHWHRSFHSVELIEHNSLSLQAGGLLTRLVHIMFSTGEAVKDDIAWITRRTSIRDKRTVRKALDELIEQGVIVAADGRLTHAKTMQEIANNSAMRAENGSKRNRPAKSDEEQSANSSPSDADLMAIKCQTGMSQVIENVEYTEKLVKDQNQSQKEERKEPPMPPDGGSVISSQFRALSVVGYSDVCVASGQSLAATATVSDLFGGEPSAPTKPTKPTKPKRSRRQVDYSVDFLRFWELNPDRGPDGHNKKRSKANWEAALEAGASAEDLIRGWGIYAESKRASADYGTQWVKSAQNFLDPEERMWTRFQSATNVLHLRPGQIRNGQEQQVRKPKLAGVMG